MKTAAPVIFVFNVRKRRNTLFALDCSCRIEPIGCPPELENGRAPIHHACQSMTGKVNKNG
jgi:hypothetical protein